MRNKHIRSMWLHDCYLRCVKNSFYVMESRISSNCTWNIHRPSLPEKGQLKRKHPWKDCQKATNSKSMHAQILILAKFYSIMKCLWKKKSDLLCKIYHVSYGGISREFLDCLPLLSLSLIKKIILIIFTVNDSLLIAF